MSKILLNALTLLSIMSCDKLINIEKLGESIYLLLSVSVSSGVVMIHYPGGSILIGFTQFQVFVLVKHMVLVMIVLVLVSVVLFHSTLISVSAFCYWLNTCFTMSEEFCILGKVSKLFRGGRICETRLGFSKDTCSLIFLYSEELCKEQMRLFVVDIGPWVRFTPTIHELYAHLPQLIGIILSSNCYS